LSADADRKAGGEAVFDLRSVCFAYDWEHVGGEQTVSGAARTDPLLVLSDISLEIAKGERVVVLGHNGSGKSTLVKIMGALQTPTRGTCFVCGRDSSADASEIHRIVSIVFQNPETQIIGAIVEDDAAFACENQGVPPPEIETRISAALGRVGLLAKRGALSSALSGGEKQRLAIAGALAANSDAMILDEPTAMLDPEGRRNVESVLNELDKTVVQVTHRLDDIAGDVRVMVLSGGKWAWRGSAEEFWDAAESLGFRLPPLVALARRLGAVATVDDVAEKLAAKYKGSPPRKPEKRRRPPSEALFAVNDLCYSPVPLDAKVLKNVSCVIPRGRWTSILGRTGSGKSTLVQHLNGLYLAQSGDIEFDGMPMPKDGAALRDLRRRVGLVFQTPEDQFFSPTVREELAFAPLNWGFPKEKVEACVASAMEAVGLDEDYLERGPLMLSGGERRLVAIASVLAAEPECVVLDEPTAGLDERYRAKIVGLLARLSAEGKTVVTVTHDFEMAFEMSDRLIVLEDGVKVYEGGVEDGLPVLLERQEAFMPDVLRVAHLLRKRGVDVPLTWDSEQLLD
jgi:energy-coupling factor transport system ATP-binding protein